MSDLDDAVASMMDDMLSSNGSTFIYCRGNTSTTVTMVKAPQLPIEVESGEGHVITVDGVDFIAKTVAFPYSEPQAGDTIRKDGSTDIYEVLPIGNGQPFRALSGSMTRIHTKQIR